MRTSLAAAAAALLALAAAAPAVADDDDLDEVRVRAACVGGTAELRLEVEDDDDDDDGGGISVELRVAVKRPVFAWRLVLVHERRILFQGTRRASSSGYGLRYVRRVPDWRGRQTVVARLSTRDGRTCRIQATI